VYPAASPAPAETGYGEQRPERAGSLTDVPHGHPVGNGAVHRDGSGAAPDNGYYGNEYNGSEYNGNGYDANEYSEASYNGNGSVVSINGNGSTTNGYSNGSMADGSGYSSGDYQRTDGDARFVRRRLLPTVPKGGRTWK